MVASVSLEYVTSIDWSVAPIASSFGRIYQEKYEETFVPKQIIFQPELKTTIVIWKDNSRTVVKCSDGEEFVPEVGFAMALVKKRFPNRSEFLRMIKKAYVQPVKIKTKKETK